MESGTNRFRLSIKQWTQKAGGIGLIAKAGRYGGTFAHKDIAFEFGSWHAIQTFIASGFKTSYNINSEKSNKLQALLDKKQKEEGENETRGEQGSSGEDAP